MADADTQDIAFGAEFAPVSRDEWRKLVEAVLKGAPFERLVAKTYDDLAVSPLYGRSERAQPVVGRPAGAPWQVMQRLDHPDPAQANAEALHDLANGAGGISMVFAGALS